MLILKYHVDVKLNRKLFLKYFTTKVIDQIDSTPISVGSFYNSLLFKGRKVEY